MKIDGACHCGNIQFEAEVDAAKVVICHCSDCQTLSGSAFRTIVPTEPGSFRLVRGVPKVYVKTADNGNRRQQTFCPDCGTPIYAGAAVTDAKVVWLRLGAVRQRAELMPRDQYWFRSAQPWLSQLSALTKRDTQPVANIDDSGDA